MTSITRYILRQTLAALLFVAVSFTAAVWLVQSLRLIDLIVNRGLSVGLFTYLAFLILPRFVDVVLPIAVFIAVLFTYNRMLNESELVVMRAAGISQAALARPALLTGAVAMTILMSLSVYFLPAANRAFKELQFEVRNRFASVLLQEGIFNTVTENLTIYVRGRDANGELVGLLIHDNRNATKPLTFIAERGAVVDAESGPRVLMVNGSRQQFDTTTDKLSVLTFEKYTLDLGTFKDAPGARDREPDERYMGELLFPRDSEGRRISNRGLIAEANLRLVTPLTALAFAAIPIACLLTANSIVAGKPAASCWRSASHFSLKPSTWVSRIWRAVPRSRFRFSISMYLSRLW